MTAMFCQGVAELDSPHALEQLAVRQRPPLLSGSVDGGTGFDENGAEPDAAALGDAFANTCAAPN